MVATKKPDGKRVNPKRAKRARKLLRELEQYRLNNDMNYTEVGELIGVSGGAVGSWLSRNVKENLVPRNVTLDKIEEVLGGLDGEDEPTKPSASAALGLTRRTTRKPDDPLRDYIRAVVREEVRAMFREVLG